MAAERTITFPLPLGLHARPASRIQETAARFRSAITWSNGRSGASADAKSVLALLASDTQPNDPCLLRAIGPDEAKALAALVRLIETDLPRLEAEAEAAPAKPGIGRDVPRILTAGKALHYAGEPAAAGIVRGPAFLLDPTMAGGLAETAAGRPAAEERAAFAAAAAALESDFQSRRGAASNAAERAVLDAHSAILRDPGFAAAVNEAVDKDGLSASGAVARACRIFSASLHATRSAYLRERMADIRDVSHQLVARLSGRDESSRTVRLPTPAVLVAEDLAPSEFLALARTKLLGLVPENAGTTSHTLILARARGIPAVTGIPGGRNKLQPGEEVIVDGGRGLLVPSPKLEIVRYFDRESEALAAAAARHRAAAALPGRTADGRRIEIAANIGHPEELASALAAGAEGIGLFRTELLLLDRTEPPGEEEQTAFYTRLARESGGRPIIIRTFDIGGDKPIPYLPMPKEANPFLGFRGIRTYETFSGLLRVQLRAVLRAAVHGPLKVMFPMVGAVEEIVAAKERLTAARDELAREGIPHRGDIETGMMVEVPSAALLVDRFADHVDFFSVGSNDLLQYVLAADRGNPAVRSVHQPLHPGFLRLLKTAVDAARARGRWIGLCGELGASLRALPLLVGLELDELSMAAAAVPAIKARLRTLDSGVCRELLERAVACSRSAEVDVLLSAQAAALEMGGLIVPALVRIGADCRSRAEVLQELAAMMEAAGRTDDRTAIEAALWRREDTFSTGIGFGVAIPHCQTDAARGVSIGILRLAAPIDWSAADGEKVDTAVMLVMPAGETPKNHLKLLAFLSRRLAHDEFREALRTAPNAAAVIALLAPVLSGATPAED